MFYLQLCSHNTSFRTSVFIRCSVGGTDICGTEASAFVAPETPAGGLLTAGEALEAAADMAVEASLKTSVNIHVWGEIRWGESGVTCGVEEANGALSLRGPRGRTDLCLMKYAIFP